MVCDCENDAASLIDVTKVHLLRCSVMPKRISSCSVTTGREYRVRHMATRRGIYPTSQHMPWPRRLAKDNVSSQAVGEAIVPCSGACRRHKGER